MGETGSQAEKPQQTEFNRQQLEYVLESAQLERDLLLGQVESAKSKNQELQLELEHSQAQLERAIDIITSIRGSLRYRLGTALVSWPLKLKNVVVHQRVAIAKRFKRIPPKRLPLEQFQSVLELLEQNYHASGLIAAEQFAREQFPTANDRSLALMRLARLVIGKDLAAARRLANEAVAVVPTPSKQKWLAFLLFDTGEIKAPARILQSLPGDLKFKPSEQHKAAVINSCRQLLERTLAIPEKAKSTPYAPKPKRILYVAASSLPYHVSGYTLRSHNILKELRKLGWDISCVTRPGYPVDRPDAVEPASYDQRDIDGVPYLAMEGASRREIRLEQYLLDSADILAQHALRERVAAIHAASNYENAIPALIAARKLGLPFIYEVRGLWEYTAASKKPGWDTSERFDLDKKLEALAAGAADRVLTLTNALAEELVDRGVEPRKITLAPNGIDIEAYQPVDWDEQLADSLGFTKNNFVVGYVGSIVAYEGLDDLVDAFALLRKELPSARLLIVGGGDALATIERQIQELNLGESVIFAGKVKPQHVRRYYSLMNVVCLPRKPVKVCELVPPLKPYEVMAMQVPLVVSDVAALKEMVDEGRTALVHRAGDPSTLFRALLSLIRQNNLGANMSDAAREKVTRENTWKSVGCSIIEIYDKELILSHAR